MDLRRFDKLQRDVEQLQREQAKAEGALEQVLKKLADDYSCQTLEEAEQLAERLSGELAEAQAEFDTGLEKFEQEYGQLLRGEV